MNEPAALGPKEFQAYVWVYWCLATSEPAIGPSPYTNLIRELCARATIPVHDPKSKSQTLGYAAAEHALWCRPNSLGFTKSFAALTYDDLSTVRRAFTLGRAIDSCLHAFMKTRTYLDLADGAPMPINRLSPRDRGVLEGLGIAPANIRFRGPILLSAKGGRRRLGIGSLVAVDWFPRVKPLSWLVATDAVRSLQRLSRDTQAFASLCRDLLGELRTKPSFVEGLAPGTWFSIFHAGGSDPASIQVFRATWEEGIMKVPACKTVLVCSALESDETLALVQAAVRETLGTGHKVLILDGENLLGHLSWYPWVWSRWLGQAGDPIIVRGADQARLRDALLPSSIAEHLGTTPPVRHPVLTPDLPESVIISGRKGAGKSTAVWMVCAERAYDIVILLRPGPIGRPPDGPSGLLAELLGDLPRLGLRRVACVIDDIHLEVGWPPAATLLGGIIRLADHARAGALAHVDVLGTYWSTEGAAVRSTYRALLAGARIPERNIDEISPEFLKNLIEQSLRAFSITLNRFTVDTLAFVFMKHSATPYAVTLFLLTHRDSTLSIVDLDSAIFREGSAYWQDQFSSLIEDGKREQVDLLLALASLREVMRYRVPLRLLRQVFCRWRSRSADVFQVAFLALRNKYWLREVDNLVYADDSQVADEIFGLGTEERGAIVAELGTHVTAVVSGESLRDRFTILRGLAHHEVRFWVFEQAWAHLRVALTLIKGLPGAANRSANVLLELSQISLLRMNMDDAVKEVELALAVLTAIDAPAKRRAGFAYQLGALLMMQEANEAAIQHLRAAYESLPPDHVCYVPCRMNLATCHARMGDNDAARRLVQELAGLELSPRDAESVRHLRDAIG
ncbi:MAG: tetratricopeptide repeat protein [Acidobacteriota bacterium]|nr:tetratricopeptide repeat protein [Acidobacteriota bacterium]